MELSPQLWIVAGPNGSGKTTLTMRHTRRFPTSIFVVNPDEIAKNIDPVKMDSPRVALQAGRAALEKQRSMLEGIKVF